MHVRLVSDELCRVGDNCFRVVMYFVGGFNDVLA